LRRGRDLGLVVRLLDLAVDHPLRGGCIEGRIQLEREHRAVSGQPEALFR